jgi:AhpD family alkylhydroperoxidase
MNNGHEEPVLSEQDQEIIAVGASIASGCLPCTRFHLRAAARAGASEEEIRLAVSDATSVRMAATAIMARAGGWSPAAAEPSIPDLAPAGFLLRELVAVSAAYAINCATNLKEHMAAARDLGASDRQIFKALEIACRIKDVAAAKAKTVAAAGLGVSEEQAGPCCGERDVESEGASGCASETRVGTADGNCSCQSVENGRPGRDRSNPKEG